MKHLLITCLICLSACRVFALGGIYGDITFAGSVYVTNDLAAAPDVYATPRLSGSWTNHGSIAWYRLAATNRNGRSAWSYSAAGVTCNVSTNAWAATNSVTLTWSNEVAGASGWMLQRRETTNATPDPTAVTNDASWPLWQALPPNIQSRTDTGTADWTTNSAPVMSTWGRTPVYPWTDVDRAATVTGVQSGLVATAWQNPAAAADWTWTSNGREITLTGYSGPNAVMIPDMLDGLPVTGFGDVFYSNTDITSVGGGANIKAVGDYAFDSFGALSSVSLPACTTVGDYAFNTCGALSSVSLPACTTVGTAAFASCVSLSSVSLPACTTVGIAAFSDCGSLSSVTFGQNAPAPAANVFDYSTPTIYVSNPHATGWGDTWNGRPVVRAASMPDIANHNTDGTAHADIRALIPTNAAPEWISTTNYAAAITLTNLLERPQYLYATGAVSVAITGLRSPLPLYLVVRGPTSVAFPGNAHYVGGSAWQTNMSNHILVWSYGTNLYVNPITTSED